MTRFATAALGLTIAAFSFAAPAFAERTVMFVTVQQVPNSGPRPAGYPGVTLKVKMDAATMAAMNEHMANGKMVLECRPRGPEIMMCDGQ